MSKKAISGLQLHLSSCTDFSKFQVKKILAIEKLGITKQTLLMDLDSWPAYDVSAEELPESHSGECRQQKCEAEAQETVGPTASQKHWFKGLPTYAKLKSS